MWRGPLVLITAPLERHHEKEKARDAEETSDVIDASKNLATGETDSHLSWWWVVEKEGKGKTDECPDAAKKTNPAPAAVVGNQLTPEDRWAEWNNREDEDRDVQASLLDWGKLRSDGERCQLVDTSTDTSNSHASDESVHGVCG